MKKLEEFEKWMKAGEPLGAQHDRVTAWAAWSTAWDAAVSDENVLLLKTIEHMDRIHTDIMDNGPRCTCGDGDGWCVRCGKSMKISRLARESLQKIVQGGYAEGADRAHPAIAVARETLKEINCNANLQQEAELEELG